MGASSRSCKYVLNTLMQVTSCELVMLLFFISWLAHLDLFVKFTTHKYVFLQTFQNKKLAHAVKEGTLESLITELLLWLLDERVPRMEDGSQLLKALNVLMLKILVRYSFHEGLQEDQRVREIKGRIVF